MAIDTQNEKLALLDLDDCFQPGTAFPSGDGILSVEDKQQFLMGYPGIAWVSVIQAEIIRLTGVLLSQPKFGSVTATGPKLDSVVALI